ncbi:response regulator [Streptomyces sp. NPDC086549]|uniref:response regulator n=1 Tax=Streptomyces sp. NPDC086549 TaxID=3365752 RepID=UPI0038245D38
MSGPEDLGAPVRVLVVDDQELVREGIASLLGIQPGITDVATACDGPQAVEAAVTHRPDGALVDVRMPGMDGIDTTAVLATRLPSCRVVMLTTFGDQDYVACALRADAVGCQLKDFPSAELARSVCLVHAGVAQLDTSTAKIEGTRGKLKRLGDVSMQVSHEAIYLSLCDPRRCQAIDRSLTQWLRIARPMRRPKVARRPVGPSARRVRRDPRRGVHQCLSR